MNNIPSVGYAVYHPYSSRCVAYFADKDDIHSLVSGGVYTACPVIFHIETNSMNQMSKLILPIMDIDKVVALFIEHGFENWLRAGVHQMTHPVYTCVDGGSLACVLIGRNNAKATNKNTARIFLEQQLSLLRGLVFLIDFGFTAQSINALALKCCNERYTKHPVSLINHLEK
jgi:hypothetical protein